MSLNKKSILITGGAGYIGSHMLRVLLENGLKPVVFDNLSTGYREFVPKGVPFVKGDLRKPDEIKKVFKKYRIDSVMHFAASICVGESVSKPLDYYENNFCATYNLLKAMISAKVNRFIFSSTAAVYGEPKHIPVVETDQTFPTNPYGNTKLMAEGMLRDVSMAYKDFGYITLRYFNAAGAHPSGDIGQKGHAITHLVPNVLKVVKGDKKELVIFGNDYPTKDGTCIRDYIHVMDLCNAHLLALRELTLGKVKNDVFNLGNGSGYSVKEIILETEKVTGLKVKTKIGPRRAGDPARIVASSKKAEKVLGWRTKYGMDDIIKTAWAWEKKL